MSNEVIFFLVMTTYMYVAFAAVFFVSYQSLKGFDDSEAAVYRRVCTLMLITLPVWPITAASLLGKGVFTVGKETANMVRETIKEYRTKKA